MFDLAIQADAGSSGGGSGRKYNAPQPGGETFQMKIANNKVCTLFYLDKGLPYHMKNTFYHATKFLTCAWVSICQTINSQYYGDCLINIIFSAASDFYLFFFRWDWLLGKVVRL